MLKLLSGPIGSGKSTYVSDMIKNDIEAGREVLVLVPDQFSFEYDKKLYKVLGAGLFNLIRVVGFRKLAETIIKLNGSTRGEFADDYTKQIIMYLAVKKLKAEKSAKYYTKQLDKTSFIDNAIELVKELRQSEITPNELSATQLELTGSLSDKISDIQYLYSEYCNILSEKGLKDSLTMTGEAATIAKAKNFFKSMSVYIDEFNGFSQDEFSMLEAILTQASDVTISLTIGYGENTRTKLSPFLNVIKTEQDIINLAKGFNLKTEILTFKTLSDKNNKSVNYINDNIFNPLAVESSDSTGIKVVACNDLYEEIEYVSSSIKRLVCDNGYKYSDIVIVSRKLSDYYSIISGVFDRYEISYFMDTKQPVSQKALILYIFSVFQTITTKKFNTENILRYIKSTLSMFTDMQVAMIEDYCFQWNVNGDMWLEGFTATDSKDTAYLEEINKIRTLIITPLKKIKQACFDSGARDICHALFAFLDEVNLSAIMSQNIKNSPGVLSDNETQAIEIAREFKQLWGILIQAIRAIYDTLQDEKITLKAFSELLNQMLLQASVSTPPQKLDAVIVASADRSHLASPKVVFLIGVNEGIMPAFVKESGLFTDKDKDALEKFGLKILRRIMWKLTEERFMAYQALSLPSDRLFISYSLSDKSGNSRRPSSIIKQLTNMFGDEIIECAWDKSPSFYCTTPHSAYYKFVENYRDKTEDVLSIKSVLEKDKEYKNRIEYLRNASENSDYRLNPKTAQSMFFSKNLNISATSIEKFNECPFSFFCQNGLKLQTPKKIEVNPVNRGTIVHYCLEKIMSRKNDKDKSEYVPEFVTYNEEELKVKIHQLLAEFRENELGGDFGKTKRFDVMYRNLESLILDVVKNIKSELESSSFTPHEFEYNLTDKNGKSIFELDLDNGLKLLLRGKIDRLDMCEYDDKKYIRIVDYKTGQKQLELQDVYNGINLQMILYLMAVTDNVENAEPAGVLYMPAIFLSPEIERTFNTDNQQNSEKDSVSKLKDKNFKKNGLVVRHENNDIMKDMINADYVQIRNKNKPDGYSDIMPYDAYNRLEGFAKSKMIEMAENLKNGKIQAIPKGEKDKLACRYCDYWSVCGSYMSNKAQIIEKVDADKLRDIIGIQTNDEAGEDNER